MGALGAAAGAGLGLIQHNQKKAEYNRQKQLAADMERWSPWTGVHGQMPGQDPNLFGDIAQGALTGASLGLLGGAGGASPGAAQLAAPAMGGAQQLGSSWASLPGDNLMAGGYSPNLYNTSPYMTMRG